MQREAFDAKLLARLVSIDSVSGDERAMSSALRTEYEKYADEIVYDNLGSIYALKKSKVPAAPRVMISGHMDESGVIIKKILANGTVKGLILGKLEPNSLLGARVQLVTRSTKKISGTVLAFDEENQAVDAKKEVMIDLGFTSEEEVSAHEIQLGDRIALVGSMWSSSNGNRVFAKNLTGCYAPLLGIELLRELAGIELAFDLYVGCTVQEQVGFRGIQTATNAVAPDLGIMLDTNRAFDHQVKVQEKRGELGKGMLLNFYDPTVLPNSLLLSTLKKICQDNQIPFQYYYSLEGSDAAWVNKLRTGTPTLFMNIPIRNLQTPTEVLDRRDYVAAKQALEIFVKELTPEKIQAFKEENR